MGGAPESCDPAVAAHACSIMWVHAGFAWIVNVFGGASSHSVGGVGSGTGFSRVPAGPCVI